MEWARTRRKQSFGWWCGLVGVLLVILAVVLILLHEEVVIMREDGVATSSVQSLTCEGDNFDYPFLSRDGVQNNIKINIVMDGDRLSVVSLVYKLFYDDSSRIESAVVDNQISMNRSFIEDNLSPDALGITYSKLQNAVQTALYAERSEINGITAKYFLLDSSVSQNKEALAKAYESQGLKCIIKDKL